ncbi:MAG: hypothetical protein GXO79_03310 [Chlorobi bacterium]|nr:hypothetical protein [Chlorobiota bacterium]
MKDLTIPIPNSGSADRIEVQVKLGAKKFQYDFRVESFPWVEDSMNESDLNIEKSFNKIEYLKKIIKDYDNNWELIQIFTPSNKSKHIQLLFRQKKNN